MIQNEKLPIKDETVMNTAVALSTIFAKNDKVPDHIEFEGDGQISLVYGDITVKLGKDEYLEDKMTRVLAILPMISEKKGILHAENVNDNSKNITLEQEQRARLPQKTGPEAMMRKEITPEKANTTKMATM